MALSILPTPARTVLLIADEALYVYAVGAKKTKLVEVVPWPTQYFEDVVIDLIKKDCGGKSVLILNDMTDLHFKGGQRIPKVGAMDKKKVLARKLQVSFPNYPIRGAIKINQDKNDIDTSAGDLFLFTAVPMSDPVVKTLEAVKRSLVSISGFYILPIEATDMVSALSQKLGEKDSKPARWAIFLGQHQDGSLRQVITRDGQLAMTRMTPVSDSDVNPEQWAIEVAQEYKATLSYLSRFGYVQDEPTEIMVVANQEASDALETQLNIGSQYTSFTILEAAKILGISIGEQSETRFADTLHVAWIGKKSRFLLPMKATDVEAVIAPRRYVTMATFALLAGAAYLGWATLGQVKGVVNVQSEIKDAQRRFTDAEAEFEAASQRIEALGIPIDLILGSLGAHDKFKNDSIDFLEIVKQIGLGVGNDLRLDEFSIKKVSAGGAARGRGRGRAIAQYPGLTDDPKIEAVLSFSFPPTIELERGIQETNTLERELQKLLPEYEVAIVRQVARPEYTQRVSGVADGGQEDASDEDYSAEISVKGPISK